MSTLGQLGTVRLEANIPPAGAWFATCWLDTSALPAAGATVLTIGDLVLAGSVIHADYEDHPGGALVVARARGGAGWRLPVTRAGVYASSAGVKLSTVLQDLTRMSNEPYVTPGDLSLGVAYTWQAHTPAQPMHYADVLADLVWRGFLPTWRVEPFTGRTRFDAWPMLGPCDGRGRILTRNRSQGRRTVGLDVQVAAFLPGATLEGVTIARTVLRETADELRADVFEAAIGSSAIAGASSSSGAATNPRPGGGTGGGGATLGGP